MNDTSAVTKDGANGRRSARQSSGRWCARARVTRGSLAQPVVELAVADVDGDHPARRRPAAGSRRSRRSSCRGRRRPRPRPSTPSARSAWSSLSPPRETYRGRCATSSSRGVVDRGRPACRRGGPSTRDLAGQHRGARLRAGGEEAARDEQRVEPLAHRASRDAREARLAFEDGGGDGLGREAEVGQQPRPIAVRRRSASGRPKRRTSTALSARCSSDGAAEAAGEHVLLDRHDPAHGCRRARRAARCRAASRSARRRPSACTLGARRAGRRPPGRCRRRCRCRSSATSRPSLQHVGRADRRASSALRAASNGAARPRG